MTDLKTISKTFTETQKKLIIDTLKENDDYNRNYSLHKKNCINKCEAIETTNPHVLELVFFVNLVRKRCQFFLNELKNALS